MRQQAAADRYLVERVNTATPAQLTGMLFDAGVGSLRNALVALEGGDVSEVHRLLVKAQDIVLELRCSLNHDAGEIAANLDALYEFLYNRLVLANVRKDAALVEEGISLLEPLQLAWREAVLGQKVPAGV